MAKPTAYSCTVNKDDVQCFNALSNKELLELEKNRLEVTYKKGEIICKQGTFATHIMYVCKGLVKIFIENEQKTLTLKILPEGNLIGLSSIYDGNNIFQYSAHAYQDSVIRLIDVNIFKKLINSNAKFASEIINILCENSLQTYSRFFAFMHKQSYGRLADLLLCLSYRIYKEDEFELLLTRKELAELAGISTERVIRILKKFKDDGLIEINDKIFKITNIELLTKISEHG